MSMRQLLTTFATRTKIQDYLRQRQAQATAFKTKIEAERPRVRREASGASQTSRRRAMLRLAIDADVHGEIVRGLRRRRSELDLVRVQDFLAPATDDLDVLAWAARRIEFSSRMTAIP